MKTFFTFLFLLFATLVFSQKSKVLISENQKDIVTLDIDHFWQAFDLLKGCKNRTDSLAVFQKNYFDNATDGMVDLISDLGLTTEDYVNAVGSFPKFYAGVRKNTYVVKTVEKEIKLFFKKVVEYYPDYKPLKVCFAISPMKAAGRCTSRFLLFGTEIIASTKELDLSEFGNSPMGKALAFDTDIKSRIILVVAHETAHQLQEVAKPEWNNYELLNKTILEGVADFVAEYLTDIKWNSANHIYGDKHEKELWIQFKKDLDAHANTDNWMYNYDRGDSDIPADLGYYVGYKIAESYYKNSSDKKQAILEMIEMKSAKDFLAKSGYEKKF